ncbi:MAG TPA: MBL fold metallo-hydrolase [Acidobacteriota bacterium]|nr:MBL fold metallo-hydrolase [Acidobacteriota bacterium]
MRICVLGSGSSGNCTLVATSKVAVLTDLGFGPRSLLRRLRAVKLDGLNIGAIFLTHGHSDHISGVVAMAAEQQIPVFLTRGTLLELGGLDTLPRVEVLSPGVTVNIADLYVTPFAISHDAAEPVGFRFEAEGVSGALATDLGKITSEVTCHLNKCEWLVLESNHDEELVRLGSYPWPLKQRLLSPVGHLSNSALAEFLSNDFDAQARHIFLAHLSRNNNTPSLAMETAEDALGKRSDGKIDGIAVHLTDQMKPSIVLDL